MNNRKVRAAAWLFAGLIPLWINASAWGQALGLNRIAVIVNDEAITDLEVKQRMTQALSMLAERVSPRQVPMW